MVREMSTRKQIAVIGAGISGLSAAWLLRDQHEVTLYEKEPRLGGHARTLEVDYNGTSVAVDTGFIVFNDRNYPHLNGLFSALGVAFHKSNMSFAARIQGYNDIEYSSRSLRGMFPTLTSLLDVRRWQMLRDYFRFSRAAKKFLLNEDRRSLGELLDAVRVSDAFREYFILPMGAAIWSCPVAQMLDYPAATFVRFFNNHGLLDYNGQPQWYTVTGGSREYVQKIAEALKDNVRVGVGAISVTRSNDSVLVEDSNGETRHYDEVIFACHADEALAMQRDASAHERKILSCFRFNQNTAYLHRDPSLMPQNTRCWASWVYLCEQAQAGEAPKLAITYWMNLLQGVDHRLPLFVTLNPPTPPAVELTFNTHIFTHPIFDRAAIDAQAHVHEINGKDRIWWCGAWQRYGFHEDGIYSAIAVVRQLGGIIPWETT
jgi:predicted NAD/FAD-binding protein